MENLNGKMIVGIFINMAVVFMALADREYNEYAVIYIICGMLLFVYFVGIVLVACGLNRTGAWMVIISSVLFVPVGLVGVLGGRSVLDKLTQKQLLDK